MTKKSDAETLSLLETLSNADGAPGAEDEVAEIFLARWKSRLTVTRDHLGSVIGTVPSSVPDAPRVAVDCHLDEVGFMVRAITRAGLLKMVPLGGFWSQALPGQRLRLLPALPGGTKLPAVIAAVSPHLLGRAERDRAVDIKDLLVDVGADSAKEAASWGIRPGIFAVPASTFIPMGRRCAGKAFDNRVGCALCIRTLEKAARPATKSSAPALPCTVVGVGSVQEEVGLRGVRTAATVAEPEIALVVEGAPADDLSVNGDEAQGKLGGGVQIRAFDPTMVASPRLVELALETAREHRIAHQLAVRPTGGTNAGRLHLHGAGVPSLVLSVPVRYAHSHVGVIDPADLVATERLVWELLKRLDRTVVNERLLPWLKN
jgi:putative aminopeptidase FrvX